MLIQSQIHKIGGSYFVKISPEAVKLLNLGQKELIEYEIKRKLTYASEQIDIDIKELKDYECLICNYPFVSDDNVVDIYCPNCGNEDTDNIKQLQSEEENDNLN